MAREAYLASAELAKEKGAFPLFDAEAFLASGTLAHMDEDVREAILGNLSSKEIAPLLNISHKSVEVKRYRLRKKMGLDHDQSLSNYIIEL